MASRTGRGAPRRSPRISGRSETPETRLAERASTPGRRALSPDLIEQMTPPAASFRSRRPLNSLQKALAAASASVSVKQEGENSTSFYVREPSQQSRLTSPPQYQPTILRGDQRGFNDTSHSASLSIFSSGSDLTDSYQQEEREVAQLQNNEQQQQAHQQAQQQRTTAQGPGAGTRRVSGQRRPRTSLDDRPYRPSDDEDDDDIGSPTRRRRRARNSNSNSLGAYELGRVDNATWMAGQSKRRGKKRANGAQRASEEGDGGDSTLDHGEEDAGAVSGKETRFDSASDSDAVGDDDDDGIQQSISDKSSSQAQKPEGPSHIARLLRGVVSLAASVIAWLFTFVAKLPGRLWSSAGRNASASLLQGALTALGGLMFVSAVLYVFPDLRRSDGSTGLGGLSGRLPSYPYSSSDDVPGNPSNALAASLDRENQRLRAELSRLTSRLDTLSSSIDSQISSSISSAAAKIQADAYSRQSSEISRLTTSTKRTVSRLAQEELKSIQDTVSASVESMLRDVDKRVSSQLKQRADDTDSIFFDRLEKEVGRITRYANDEVNARLGQAFDQTFLSELIDDKLEKYARDRTGKVDWAAVTSGAWVAKEGTVHRGYRFNSIWNVGKFLAQGRKVPIGDPVKAITPGAGLGEECWMTGWNSLLQVNLAEPKVVEELMVEHPLPGMTRTAPRRIMAWGLVDESDRQYYQQYRRSKAKTQEEYLKSLLPEPFYNAVPQEYKEQAPLLLAAFEFKANGSTLQTFNLTEEAQMYPYGVGAVRWQFVDGWAKNPPICVHRVRVHGGEWPVFADRQVDSM
ncbi:uncharacterized protein UBRO_02200 [Ustilago bromivora]|uniref:SUN domain-containing protein n=1 Tax=Ustilago bromivora TaxID=307758 RepID=A0A1K0G0J9_9BASI|nr:uncharacterized protein UBRO_02200 [Ustilago bromivora]SYW78287.1 uncharacterized protein UBRO2_02479 [Ustilago bromivora]